MSARGAAWLDQPLRRVLGERTAKALDKGLNLRTVEDLLRHYPRHYVSGPELTDIGALRIGEHATVLAIVAKIDIRPMRKRPGLIAEVTVSDGRQDLQLTFFARARHVENYWRRALSPGTRALFAGKVDLYRGERQLVNPSFESLPDEVEDQEARLRASRIIPIYPACAQIPSWRVGLAVQTLLGQLSSDDVPDPVPAELLEARRLPNAADALLLIHAPTDDDQWRRARRRFTFEEAFVLQAALARRRATALALPATPRPAAAGGLLAAFDARLPFTLTNGQREVGEQISAELAREHPMHRLLQGEVGSGKTVVALRAMLTVVDAGGQAALLAPTEVLAAQHLRSITELLGDLAAGGMLGGAEHATRVALLTGSQPTTARRQALLDAASGSAGIVVGTHALLQENVEFFDLGLVVVDEQHRFGVEQRDALRSKAFRTPHLLVMTATPIPRTVAMTVFGDLETSTLTEVPGGRAPVVTHVADSRKPAWMKRVWERMRDEVAAGRQVFVVCPRIGGGEGPGDEEEEPTESAIDLDAGLSALDSPAPGRRPAVAAADLFQTLRAEPLLSGARIALLHGKLPPEEKDATMRAFARGEVDVLVATTVIEVGIDVPNASGMVIMDADWFGVSQLHQLRGRIGRGQDPGICLLVTEVDPGSPAAQRLQAVAKTNDGFELSQVDLDTRREGDVLGSAQSGWRSSLRLLRVLRDVDVISDARSAASALVAADPSLAGHAELARAIERVVDPDRASYLERG